jgi:N-acetyl-anhydromuramyl-L-alanine amidase AmpD
MKNDSLLVALVFSCVLVSCSSEEELPLGPPGCEPTRELELERDLKAGFRALAEGKPKEARQHFAAVEKASPRHPEAFLGERLASERGLIEAGESSRQAKSVGLIAVLGELIPVDFPVERGRLDFEEAATLAPLRHARDNSSPIFEYVRPRRLERGEARQALERLVDLIVLHDTRTQTARESFVELEAAGGSTHFIIDWDGRILQTLDLGLEANHTRVAEYDARSISIDLVNPVDATRLPPLPELASKAQGPLERPRSEPMTVQGQEMLHWGYTTPQLESLNRLIRALARILPGIPREVLASLPGDGPVPRQLIGSPTRVTGVVGHLHLSPKATDPGAGFPWEAFAKQLNRP